MICYRINRPFEAICDAELPKADVWRELGLGHLLPIKVTGRDYPVTRLGDSACIIGPAAGAQDWIRVTDELSIALVGSKVFVPEFCQRPVIVPGTKTADKMGRDWIIPNANPQSPYLSIPHEFSWSLNGPTMVPDEAYRPVMDLCARTFAEVAEMTAIPQLWAAARCLEILQLNYRIGHPELAALQSVGQTVIDRDFAARVVLWFIDYQLLEDIVKKKQPAA